MDAAPDTGTGIVDTSHGTLSGNAFLLVFALDTIPGNPLAPLRMSQGLYLQSDRVTLLNRSTLSKEGVVVAQITESFKKEH